MRLLRRLEPLLLPAVAALAVAALAGLPLALLAGNLVLGEGVASVLGHASTWKLLGRSLALAAAVTAGSLALGAPLGVLCGRTDLPGRRTVWLLHAFPMLLPPFLIVLGAFHLLGRQGILGGETTAHLLFSDLGLGAVLVLVFAPVVTTLVAVAAQGVDPSLEEAGRVVARPLTVLFRIVLPATRPALALGAILVFSLAFAELGVPLFLRREVYPAAVFARLGGVGFAPGEAMALSLPLAPLALALVLLERRWCGRRSFAVLGLRGGERAKLPLGRWRAPAGAAGLVVAALAVAPLATLFGRAAAGGGFAALAGWLGDSVWNSVAAGLATAALTTALGVVVGYELVRGGRLGAVLDGLLLFTFLLPAAVLGVGLIAAWNRPAVAGVYGSMAILVLAASARYGVVAVRGCAVAFGQSSPRLVEAARVHGVGYLRRLLRLVVPAHRRGVAAAFLLTFVFVMRDLETAVILYPPGGEPLTVRIFTLEANGPEPVVAALATLHVALTAAAVALGWRLLRRPR